jgi:hypothetical protein
MEDAIKNGGGQSVAVVEDLRPVFVSAVRGDHHWGALVAPAHDLEQQAGAIDGQVTEFVEDEDGGLEIAA